MILEIITTIINEIIAPSVEGYIFVTLIIAFGLEERFNIKHYSFMVICEFIVLIEVIYANSSDKSLLQLLIFSMFLILMAHINFKGSLSKKIICYGLLIAILLIGEAITFIILSIIGIDPSSIYTSDIYYAYAVIITAIIKLSLSKIILLKLFKTKVNYGKGYMLQIILLTLFSLIACFAISEIFLTYAIEIKSINFVTTFMIFASFIFIPLFGMFISTKVIKQTKKQAEQQQLFEQYQIEYRYAQNLNKVLDNLRILKHDLKNHISCMWGLVETNNIEDFRLYLSNLTEELDGLKDDELVPELINTKVVGDE